MKGNRVLHVVVGCLMLAGISCSGDGTGVENGGNGGNGGGVTLSGDVQPIFTANCALSGCHAGASPAQNQNLSTGQTFSNTVGVPSVEVPSLDRVEPGDPANSYLVHKIEGTAGTVGGENTRMPLGMPPLSQSDINLIRAWIAAGALNN